MSLKRFILLICFFIFFFKINLALSTNIKIIAQVNDLIITNEDLRLERSIFKYLIDDKLDNQLLNKIALDNLIENNLKKTALIKEKISISEADTLKYLEIILNNNKKSIQDFRLKFNGKEYEKYLKERIQIEMSWNKLVILKFSNLIDINIDELIAVAKVNKIDKNSKKIDNLILIEKQKKLESLSKTYFNEVKNQALIKYL